MIESLSLLLTRSNATFTGRYYNFEDVTLDPRPSRMPPRFRFHPDIVAIGAA